MAKFELKFIDAVRDTDYIKVEIDKSINDDSLILIHGKDTTLGEHEDNWFSIYLDKSTAIKFAKTLRTEINKITESEVSNGGK